MQSAQLTYRPCRVWEIVFQGLIIGFFVFLFCRVLGSSITSSLIASGYFSAVTCAFGWGGCHQRALQLTETELRMWGGNVSVNVLLILVSGVLVVGSTGVVLISRKVGVGALLIAAGITVSLFYEEYCRKKRHGRSIPIYEIQTIEHFTKGKKRFVCISHKDEKHCFRQNQNADALFSELGSRIKAN